MGTRGIAGLPRFVFFRRLDQQRGFRLLPGGRLGLIEPPDTPSERDRWSDLIGQQEDRMLLASGDYEGLSPEIVQHELRTDMRARRLLQKRQEAVIDFRKQVETRGERFVMRGEPRDPLWYVFDVTVFKGTPGRMRVEVHYQFNLQDLKFTWQDSLYVASYRAEGVLVDENVREAGRDSYTERVTSDDHRSTLTPRLVPGQLTFFVPEGQYRLAVRCVDLDSGSEGAYTTDVEVPRLDSRQLAMSDVLLATKIVYAGDDWRSRFVKHDRLVVPNPIRAYQHGHQLTGYFEIYGLALDASNVCHYEVSYSILPRLQSRSSGWTPPPGTAEKPFVVSSFQGDGGSSDLVEDLRIDVGALASDAYDLVLTVRDLVAGTEASTRTSFSLLD